MFLLSHARGQSRRLPVIDYAHAPMNQPLTTPFPTAPLPLPADRAAVLSKLTSGLDPATLIWLSGYLAGLAERPAPSIGPAEPAAAVDTLTIVYGSQTGNARRAAEALLGEAGARGLHARLLRADAYPLAELKRETWLAIVISTQGDGDPPDDARGLVDYLLGRRAPRLEALKFAVLGLGDSSYPKFCAIARVIDARLEALGGTRLSARGEADVEIDSVAAPWRTALVEQLAALRPASAVAHLPQTVRAEGAEIGSSAAATRAAPAAAELLTNLRLTARDSDRDTRHLEFAIDPTRLDYTAGDAAGVWPQQDQDLVEALLTTTGLDGGAMVSVGDEALALRSWLRNRRELTRLNRPLLQAHAARSDSTRLKQRLADADATAALLRSTPLLDLLQDYPAVWSAAELVDALRPLAPRLYSIASSRAMVGDELHLTVCHAVFAGRDGPRYGAASHYLATLAEGAQARLYIERNPRFRLPVDATREVIMIGPGTGVAPFRAFVQERAASGASGRNWLLFGNPHLRSDFLYQTEWQQALKDGRLQRLDVAFSRDGVDKTYVQHRLREHGRAVFDALHGGAHLYVCGDASRMARDVHATLLEIAQTHGALDADAAADFLSDLERQGRYARDVY